MNPLEQLLFDNANEQNTRHGILLGKEVVAIEEAIMIGRKVDEMYASRNEEVVSDDDSTAYQGPVWPPGP
ncbi:hypothetical protein LCGC14_1209750 [marine sediment metagenome]|uniref:Uncharacterized protein n=1 Tax=marine sediment metagenome TaxID=412755 RepID=A0A0F9NWS8_9ZZZZ